MATRCGRSGRERGLIMRTATIGAVGLVGLLTGCAGGEPTTPGPPGPGPVARLEVFATDSALLAGHSLQLQVAAWDSADRPVTNFRVVWRSLYPDLLPVDSLRGLVQAAPEAPSSQYPVWAATETGSATDTLRLHVARPGEVKWRVPIGSVPDFGGPAQAPDGTLYVLGDAQVIEATLYAISARGVVRWTRHLDWVSRYNYPIVGPDGSVYVVGQYVWAFSPDGTLRWSIQVRPTENLTNFPHWHAGALGADGVLYAEMGYDLFALRALDGDTVWAGPRAADCGWLVPPTVSVDGHTLYMRNTATATIAFGAATGAQRWSVPDPFPADPLYVGGGPAVAGSRLLVPTYGGIQEMDTAGRLVGVAPGMRSGQSEPVVAPDGAFYVVHANTSAGIEAFNTITAPVWVQRGFKSLNLWYGGPALAAGGILYTAAVDAFYALQLGPSGATVRWRYPAAAAESLAFHGAPLIGPDGTVYTITGCILGDRCAGELVAFWEDKPVEPNSPWPMWRHDARRSGQASR
jgi:outer membrane protein assembly factor BamB